MVSTMAIVVVVMVRIYAGKRIDERVSLLHWCSQEKRHLVTESVFASCSSCFSACMRKVGAWCHSRRTPISSSAQKSSSWQATMNTYLTAHPLASQFGSQKEQY
eukprot:scaffold2244_cov114-Skeletonema_marinoi.AAC.1